jgi:FtsP/CotA-like multicopper oxidase with cupredoxin domain
LLLAPAVPVLTPRLAKADHTLRIRRARVELAPGRVITTTTYNGEFPGPVIRSTVGRPTLIDVVNDTDAAERIQWHGHEVGYFSDVPTIPSRGMRRLELTRARSGLSFYHSDVTAATDLSAGLYSGQAGVLYAPADNDPGRFDREVVLVLKEFEPYLRRGQHGCEVGYRLFTINGRMLGHGEPITVNAGDRVLFHVLNASASETRCLALPGHTFQVAALDGNSVPTPAKMPALQIGPSESVSAIVAMSHPGVWILGDLCDEDRERGMGTVVEYAGRRGEPVWTKPTYTRWDYTSFGADRGRESAETLDLVWGRAAAPRGGFSRWTLNGKESPAGPLVRLQHGSRYRLRMRNASDADCPIRLQHHELELTASAGRRTAGVLKEVLTIGAREQVEVEFVARHVGRALLHSTRQMYRDFGLMALIECV